jgi:hypothetical protein
MPSTNLNVGIFLQGSARADSLSRSDQINFSFIHSSHFGFRRSCASATKFHKFSLSVINVSRGILC